MAGTSISPGTVTGLDNVEATRARVTSARATSIVQELRI